MPKELNHNPIILPEMTKKHFVRSPKLSSVVESKVIRNSQVFTRSETGLYNRTIQILHKKTLWSTLDTFFLGSDHTQSRNSGQEKDKDRGALTSPERSRRQINITGSNQIPKK